MRQAVTKEEFQALRSKGIGASEIASIIGENPYQTPLQLWQKKTGRVPAFEGNAATKAGHMLENAVAMWFEEETGHKIIRRSKDEYTVKHPVYDFIFCHPDREYFHSGSRKNEDRAALECKTTRMKIDGDVPTYWFCQLQYQMGLLGYSKGAIAWLESGVDFHYQEFGFDVDFFEEIIRAAVNFWENHVLTDTPPEPINSEDIQRLFPVAKGSIEASDEMADAYTELIKLRASIKELEGKKKEIEEAVKMAVGENELVMMEGQKLFSWKTVNQNRFDGKGFQAVHPELYDEFKKQSSYRRFMAH